MPPQYTDFRFPHPEWDEANLEKKKTWSYYIVVIKFTPDGEAEYSKSSHSVKNGTNKISKPY